jgi:hypothetical protein
VTERRDTTPPSAAVPNPLGAKSDSAQDFRQGGTQSAELEPGLSERQAAAPHGHREGEGEALQGGSCHTRRSAAACTSCECKRVRPARRRHDGRAGRTIRPMSNLHAARIQRCSLRRWAWSLTSKTGTSDKARASSMSAATCIRLPLARRSNDLEKTIVYIDRHLGTSLSQ